MVSQDTVCVCIDAAWSCVGTNLTPAAAVTGTSRMSSKFTKLLQ